MVKTRADYRLCLITDRNLSGGRSTSEIVEKAIAGGITIVQLREKDLSTPEFINEASRIKRLLDDARVPLIINDRTDVALAVDADGVHLGQDDLPIEFARQVLGREKIVGVSVDTVEQAREAETKGADYIGVGSIFATATKSDAGDPIGLERLAQIRAAVSIPIVGIGGIGRDNARSVIEAGADGIAVVSSIVSADDPCAAAQELMKKIQ